MAKKILLIIIIFQAVSYSLSAQTMPIGTPALDDYYRRQQLLNYGDSLTSFTVRPIFNTNNADLKSKFYPDSSDKKLDKSYSFSQFNFGKGFTAVLLPLSIQTQFNSDHPYGWNDGAMIPAKGLQTLVSAGIYAKFGILSVQFKPEFISAANDQFETLNKNHYDTFVARYYDFYNNIDLPVRFGTKSYTKAYWGQSSIRLTYNSFSLGLSTENLWWGPGIRNSLLMSNSAPGFKHITINTVKPIKTPIGSFEGQFIAGRLENSGYGPLEPDSTHLYFGNPLYVPKSKDWRYISGIVVTWQPKWVSGLFLGLASSSQLYSKDLGSFGNYFPFFSPVKKITTDVPINQPDRRSSLFMRWVLPQEQAEFYFEYGTSNSTNDLRNLLLQPQDARAYVFGMRKFVPFNKERNENILISLEVTQLAETSPDKIYAGQEWYVNSYIRQGYTNNGQLLGAGIGPGANSQTLDVSWVKGLKRLGIQFERYIHNDDFYIYTFSDNYDWRRHWVDLSISLNGEWNYKNLIFNAKIQSISSLNYQYYIDPKTPVEGTYYQKGLSASNIQLQAGLTYRF